MLLRKLKTLRRAIDAVFSTRDAVLAVHTKVGDAIDTVSSLQSEVATLSGRVADLQDRCGQLQSLIEEYTRVLDRQVEVGRVTGSAVAAAVGAIGALQVKVSQLSEGDSLAAITANTPAEAQYYRGLNAVGILNYESDYASGERSFLTRLLQIRPTATVFDVGAHAGEYSRLVRSLASDARIYAFEPHPISFAELAAAETGATLLPIGLGETSRTQEIFDYADADGSQHASLYRDVIECIHKRPAIAHTIRIEPLTAVASDLGVDRIDLLKIDAEGHELAVLRGGDELFREGRIDVVQFEFNEMNAISRTFFRDFWNFLTDYRLFRLLPDGAIPLDDYRPTYLEVFAFQNIVAVRRNLDASWLIS